MNFITIMNNKIQLVVFDWAGTTTDFGSQAPTRIFDRTFSQLGLRFPTGEINAPMGMEKKLHIRTMLSTESGMARWNAVFNRPWNEDDVERIYQKFEENLREVVAQYSHVIPGVAETVEVLCSRGISIGSTTGYNQDIMRRVAPVAAGEGFFTTFGLLTRAFIETIDEVSANCVEALSATGAGYLQCVFQAIIPSSLPGIVSWVLYMIETNIRSSTLIGMLTATGIGYLFDMYYKSIQFPSAGLIVLFMVVLVIVIESISNQIRKVIL